MLNNKKKNIVRYRTPQLYLQLGMKLKTVQFVLPFSQQAWLKSSIDFNKAKRKEAKTAFEEDFFKLMKNAQYGKSLENVSVLN